MRVGIGIGLIMTAAPPRLWTPRLWQPRRPFARHVRRCGIRPRAARGDILVYPDGSIQTDDAGHVGVDNEQGGCCCGSGTNPEGSASGSGDDGGDTGDGDLDPIPCSEPLGCDFTVVIGPPSPKTCSCPGTDPLYDPKFNICPGFGQLTAICTSLDGAGGGWTFAVNPVTGACERRKGGGQLSWRHYNTQDTDACAKMHEVCLATGYKMVMGAGGPGVTDFGLVVGTSAETGGCDASTGINSGLTVMSFSVVCRDGFWTAGSFDAAFNFIPGKAVTNTTYFFGESSCAILR